MKQHIKIKTTILPLLIALGCFALFPKVHAVTSTVINTDDSGAGSLRQALVDSNDGDTIDATGISGAILLTSGELLVNRSVTINGPGSDNLAVDGNHASRVFRVSGGVTVTIAGLTITNGSVAFNDGGGIYNDHSTLTVSNCTLSGNSVTNEGGAISNAGSFGRTATLTVTNCTLSGNSALDEGGGIYNGGFFGGSATLEVLNSTLSGNSALNGGGIYNDGFLGSATLEVLNCTLSGNSATNVGGGISNVGVQGSGTLKMNNSTLSGNSAGYGGGGIYSYGIYGSATLKVLNSTLSGNGISNLFATSELGSTIFNGGASIGNIEGTITSLGYNLSSDGGGAFLIATGDQINTDPMLGPLQDNGGPTYTHELLSGSPAIDAGDSNFTPPPDYDQRGPGYNRVAHGRIDIGAFEIQTVTPSYAGQVQPPINPDGTSTFNFGRGVVPVKFTVTQGGVATCELPPATIAVTRMAGGLVGEVNESVYSVNADTGSNFRIDSCQYIYNLNSRALGVGTYHVDILIDGQVVGSATFALN